MAALERSTQEVMETLGEDYDRCHMALIDCINAGKKDKKGSVTADYEFFARQLIRAAFAYIEAVTFSVKAHSAWQCMERNLPIEPEERYFATDVEFEISEKGEVVGRSARISLIRNVRFAILLHERVWITPNRFDPSIGWWSNFKKAVRIRDRLTHPKLPGDLDVSPDELITVMEAKRGFEDYLSQSKRKRRIGRSLGKGNK
jgi:hypothetical protein